MDFYIKNNLLFVGLLAVFFISCTDSQKSRAFPPVPPEINVIEVADPQDLEVCFSPLDPCVYKLARFIASAKKSLDIAVFDITHEVIVHTIIVQSKRIPVRMVVDSRQAKGKHSSVRLLRKAGVSVRFGYQRGLMHNKFTIVDGSHVETGSFNYTHNASIANQENQIYLFDPQVTKHYVQQFEMMWQEAE